MSTNWLNLNQPPEELAGLFGDRDYYSYLRSPQFRDAFFDPIATILRGLGVESLLDVGCGEAILGDYFELYTGLDGSATALRRAKSRGPHIQVLLCRFENPPLDMPVFDCVLFGGVMEVLIKPDKRVAMADHYISLYAPKFLAVYDLDRLDTTLLQGCYGKPLVESWMTCRSEGLEPIEPAKLRRKILVWRV